MLCGYEKGDETMARASGREGDGQAYGWRRQGRDRMTSKVETKTIGYKVEECPQGRLRVETKR